MVCRVLLMDVSQAAFGLDIRAASRIYFINPVLNPQVEAQAIGRVRRLSQQRPVSVETLVLRGSIDEVLLERKTHMTQAEHRQVKSILDIRTIYDWIKNAMILLMPDIDLDNSSQMTMLSAPLHVFGSGFGRQLHPDEGIIIEEKSPSRTQKAPPRDEVPQIMNGIKRPHDFGSVNGLILAQNRDRSVQDIDPHPPRRVRFAED